MSPDYGYQDYAQGMRQKDWQAIQAHQRRYVPRFQGCRRVLDLGSGEGLFLALLAEAGIPAEGVDRDPGLVQEAQKRGLKATVQDGADFCLKNPGAFDGIFCSHLIEHMPFPDVARLIHAAAGALAPAGRLLVVFPNPESIRMQCFGFWKDPEHVRFYHADLIRSVCEKAGLSGQIILPQAAEPPIDPPMLSAGHQDWPAMDLASAVARHQEDLKALPTVGAPPCGCPPPSSIPPTVGAAPCGRPSSSFPPNPTPLILKLLAPLSRALFSGQGPHGELLRKVDHLSQSLDALSRRLDAQNDLLAGVINALGSFHERQAQNLTQANITDTQRCQAFNQSLGHMVQTLNAVWGVPEEAAVLATKP
jgi:SAM-dependent methyltransferase